MQLRSSLSLCLAVAACGGGSAAPIAPATPVAAPAVTPAPAVESPPAPARPVYPPTRRDDVVDEIHGVQVSDPYRWLEDASQPEVQAWMTAQDQLSRGQIASLPQREQIAARLREVFYVDAFSAPTHHGKRYFWVQKHKDKTIRRSSGRCMPIRPITGSRTASPIRRC